MKVAGFTIVRNAIKYNYPIVEAIESVLPICDEFIVAVGKSEDQTLELIKSIKSDKIKIIETTWDDSLREGGKVLAVETNKAFAAISKDMDWCFYIQGDEGVHEKYLPIVKKAMQDNLQNNKVEGLLFNYKHFYGSYDYYAHARNWYRKEIRVVRNIPGITSYKDAQGFRINDRKLNVKQIDAEIYHYGWVKPPEGYTLKFRDFNKLWHSDEVVNQKFNETYTFNYENAGKLYLFKDSHPKVMQQRINQVNWKFDLDPTKVKAKSKVTYKVLDWIEKFTGYRFFEYKNYNKI
ncbi:glycosyltransferase family protein [Flavobacterium algicola]|uniref:glycosyltransferase family 2 protein n=1 Tax=Flavobacterium algicola TaxID=556529 RepID=UPI001EFC3E60|nr:glycosyltransferase family 2 protein [Flavobacterium algicola]MCG9791097.1 glycosyltransferase family 2 protein [Flavobacterium algicola]